MNPYDTFRVKKMTRSEATHLINTRNPDEFYLVETAIPQCDIEERLYRRNELNIYGRMAGFKAMVPSMHTLLRFSGMQIASPI